MIKINGSTNGEDWAKESGYTDATAISACKRLWVVMEAKCIADLSTIREKHNILVDEVDTIIAESSGVVGLGSNGEVTPWIDVIAQGWLDGRKPIL